MEALIEQVRPKLHQLGDRLAPFLSANSGDPMFPHVARHARRTVHPPEDTWVAWANSKKGYKALPHFQMGLWSTHLFIQFAVIYECPNKEKLAVQLEKQEKKIRKLIPAHYFWSTDHTRPEVIPHKEMNSEQYAEMVRKLKDVKKAEALCGLSIKRDDPLLVDGEQLIHLAEETFATLMPLYRIST